MTAKNKLLFCWSGGKDSALALHALLDDASYDIAGLLTTVTEDYGRVSMHGFRRDLLHRQADAIGLELQEVLLPADGSNELYETRMRDALQQHKRQGIRAVAFGDIFLADVRRHRQTKLAELDLEALFPLWGQDTTSLARRFIALGFQAMLSCVDGQVLDGRFAGRAFDADLLNELPDDIDPCGENGEFHSFVYDGPIFQQPVACRTGPVVLRDNRFYFCDITARVRHPHPLEG